MARSSRLFPSTFVIAASFATWLVPRLAGAQTITPLNGGPTVRLDANGKDVTSQERPQNLNPKGINFHDCMANMSLGFPVSLSGFNGQSLQVWVGSQDCTQDTARGVGAVPTCWKVAELGALNTQSAISQQLNVRMQDIVGPQNAPPSTGALVKEDSSACYAQTSYAPVPLEVAFVPVNASGLLSGTATSFPVDTDLVGPPAPVGTGIAPGSGLLVLDWTPNVDPDTAGYDVYIGSVAQLSAAASASDAGPTLVCDEAGAPDGGDASTGAVACHYVAPFAAPAGCGGTLFSQSFVPGNGGSVTVLADGGASTIVRPTGGGISEIPPRYLVSANGTTTMTVSSPSADHDDITGLTNGTSYTAVVAAVDGFGNIGPPSEQVCDAPQAGHPVTGGSGSGGSCAVGATGAAKGESVPWALLGALAFGLLGRRRHQSVGIRMRAGRGACLSSVVGTR